MPSPHRVLLCHSPVDERHRDALVRHLYPLVDKGIIEVHPHSVVDPAPNVRDYDAVVVLMSPEMAATPCLSDVLLPSVPRQTPILPVVVRACAWEHLARLSRRAALPRGLKPVEEHPDPDGVWRTVANGIRIACEPPEQELPSHGKPERVLSRVAVMALGLAMAAAGPLWLWLTGAE